MREWLSGGAPPCQGGGRGFDPRLALLVCPKVVRYLVYTNVVHCVTDHFFVQNAGNEKEVSDRLNRQALYSRWIYRERYIQRE